MTLSRTVGLVVALSSSAFAQGTEGPEAAPAVPGPAFDSNTPTSNEAKALVERYLLAVKAKKWAEAKKFLHPKTIQAIAERKKRLGKEDHPMAPWYHEKIDSYLKDFKVTSARETVGGTAVVEVSEDNYQVQEKGMAPGEGGSYLVGKQGGKWFVVDKKRGETFTVPSIKLGYKGWFDKVAYEDEVPKQEVPTE
jgi:hypothetical protein